MKTLKMYLETKGISQEDFNGFSAEKQAEIYNELNTDNAQAFKALQEDVNTTKEQLTKAQDLAR